MSLQPTIKANHYMVSAGHYLATEAGYKVLEAGGNAFDAGVASGIALGVVQPRDARERHDPGVRDAQA